LIRKKEKRKKGTEGHSWGLVKGMLPHYIDACKYYSMCVVLTPSNLKLCIFLFLPSFLSYCCFHHRRDSHWLVGESL